MTFDHESGEADANYESQALIIHSAKIVDFIVLFLIEGERR